MVASPGIFQQHLAANKSGTAGGLSNGFVGLTRPAVHNHMSWHPKVGSVGNASFKLVVCKDGNGHFKAESLVSVNGIQKITASLHSPSTLVAMRLPGKSVGNNLGMDTHGYEGLAGFDIQILDPRCLLEDIFL
jgi:hypothetical protein